MADIRPTKEDRRDYGPTSLTVTSIVALAACPHPSVMVRVTVYVPAAGNVRDVDELVLVPATPKSHAYVIRSPTFGSDEPTAEKLHTSNTHDGALSTGRRRQVAGRLDDDDLLGHCGRDVPFVPDRQRHVVGARRRVGPCRDRAVASAVPEVPRVDERRGVLVARSSAVERAHVLDAAVRERRDRRFVDDRRVDGHRSGDGRVGREPVLVDAPHEQRVRAVGENGRRVGEVRAGRTGAVDERRPPARRWCS